MKSRRRITLLIAVLFILSTGTIAAYQSLSNTIAIVDDGKVTQYETTDIYVGELLQSKEIELGEQDTITPSLDTEIENGMKITIERFRPTVNINLNGEAITLKTTAQTVGELLEELNIQLKEGDIVSPEEETEITEDLVVTVSTEVIKTEVVEQIIPFETIVETTSDLPAGEEVVIEEGIEGITHQTIEITSFGGEIIEEIVVEEEVIEAPQPEVIQKGTQNAIVDPTTGAIYEYTQEATMNATAYTHQPGDRWYNQTASGMPTFVGMVAVDRSVIPLGTVLYVEDYGLAIAGDVGGAIKGNKIDLYFDTTEEVYNFGRRDKKVYLLSDQTIDVMAERGVK